MFNALLLLIAATSAANAEATLRAATPWRVREITRTKAPSGEYIGPDTVVFDNGFKLVDLGYKVTMVGTYPSRTMAKAVFFSALTCWECEPDVELVVFSTAKKTFKKIAYSGTTQMIGDEDDSPGASSDIDAYQVKSYVGHCGKYVAISVHSTRKTAKSPFTLEKVETVEMDSSGNLTVAEKKTAEPSAHAGGDCQEAPPIDTHQYK